MVKGFSEEVDAFRNVRERYSKVFLLMKGEKEILKFKFSPRSAVKYKVIDVYDTKELPITFKNSNNVNTNLSHYITNRIIQTNRRYLKEILDTLKLNDNEPLNLLMTNHGLSLNDIYWFKEDGELEDFRYINLYENDFDMSISNLFLIGSYDASPLGGSLSSPEITTDGMLAKGWRKEGDKLFLLKRASTFGYWENLESLTETLASKVARGLFLNHVDYSYTMYHKHLCSKCEAFTSLEKSYIPFSAFRYSDSSNIEVMMDIFNALENSKLIKDEYRGAIIEHFQQMIIFDYIIENRDRHFKNYGFLVNSKTNNIIDLSPIFDNGMSLFFNFSISQLESVNINTYEADMSMIRGYRNSNYIEICDKQIIQNMLENLHKLNNNYDFLDEIFSDIEGYFNLKGVTDPNYYTDIYYNKVTSLLKVREVRLEEFL